MSDIKVCPICDAGDGKQFLIGHDCPALKEPDSGMVLYAEEPIDRPYWNFRVVKNTLDQFFAICIVEHAPDGSVIFIHKPEDSYPSKVDPAEFAKDIRRYINALNRPVLEVP